VAPQLCGDNSHGDQRDDQTGDDDKHRDSPPDGTQRRIRSQDRAPHDHGAVIRARLGVQAPWAGTIRGTPVLDTAPALDSPHTLRRCFIDSKTDQKILDESTPVSIGINMFIKHSPRV
jgi:hypothetical protein